MSSPRRRSGGGSPQPHRRQPRQPAAARHLICPDRTGRCDFCGATLTSTSSRFDAGPVRYTGAGYAVHFTGPWAACANCAPLVRARAWGLLLRRLTDQQERTGQPSDFYASLAVHSMWIHALAPQLGAEHPGGTS